jgi:hypothetical protein
MTLNIKNPETHRLATELARLTGETLTQAVTEGPARTPGTCVQTAPEGHRCGTPGHWPALCCPSPYDGNVWRARNLAL